MELGNQQVFTCLAVRPSIRVWTDHNARRILVGSRDTIARQIHVVVIKYCNNKPHRHVSPKIHSMSCVYACMAFKHGIMERNIGVFWI